MARSTVEQLQQELADVKRELARLSGRSAPAKVQEQLDRVERGSAEHAAMLMLRRATDEDELVIDGWALEDITNWPPTATNEYLRRVLRQKVNELTAPMPETQSEDPRKPHFAPTMWEPKPGKGRFSQTTE